ncbi:sulfotransferase family cytosolic 1B member 1-like [Pomacea canaliculata]|uniref:sulfotransferase family cytosolic 1B member 1-like n=1 Tax=Pomacea canaliculata TaxID=400727 RepID=UPI000D729046|nr:sulfotransferase family cytosolic 1B member 1-like [Pomacea canaliculata]XP_025090224.1 sulfotransferase family cytosolic 1B member 1-like [Pomacea canaliculata]XP_025090225.1 sulfotransferase family cytosolic 1B member 1-like [Pomacea canaliculata]XP_025090226.1 sulfotransferase family cytosolic 1B member 1-like [Pomacea canaliculata]
MESEAVQTAAVENGEATARSGSAGTMTFLGDDPRPFTYILDGFAFYPMPPPTLSTSWDVHIDDLKQMQLRDDDLFILAYPKAGTHWLWEVTSMLLQGKAEYDSRPKEELMVEFTDLNKLEKTPAPRIFNSHLPFHMLPWQQMKEKRTKILHVYRNPKDSCVSYYHHLNVFDDTPIHDMAFNDFCELFFSGRLPLDNYFWHMKQFTTFSQENPDVPVLSLSFEDMKKSPTENIKRLATFLEVDVDDKLCEDIADACSFKKLKKGAEIKKVWCDYPENENKEKKQTRIEFYRKGEIGDWKNYFTVAMSEKMDAVIKERMEGLPYGLQYS